MSVVKSFTIKVKSPDGTVFVIINEENNKPTRFEIHIGKAGSTLHAWADAVGRLISMSLDNGCSLHKVLAELSGITSDRISKLQSGVNIRSGPEAVAYAIMTYVRDAEARLHKELNLDEMDYGDLNTD